MEKMSRVSQVKSVYEIVSDSVEDGTITFEEYFLPFFCNRGLAVQSNTGDPVCFCPPSFYGSQCQFFSDRITVVTHLDLSDYRSSSVPLEVIKMLTTFLFKAEIIDYYVFYVNPQKQSKRNDVKQTIYFVYLRLEEYLQMKKSNRNGTQFYSVRFEAFYLHHNGTIEPIGI